MISGLLVTLLTLLSYAPFVFSAGSTPSDFLVKGNSLPGISSHVGDLGDSWAGKIPISPGDSRSLFFWLWPPTGKDGADTLTIWLQGGPGASGFKGLLQEIGPFLLPVANQGPAQVIRNKHSFTQASWLLVVDQPAGVGLSDGPAKAKSEQDVANEFTDWLLNLMKTFPDLKTKKIAIVAESYGSQYAFYISDRILQNTGLRLNKLGIISGILTDRKLQQQAPLYEFTVRRQDSLHLKAETMEDITHAATLDGLDKFVLNNLIYPPKGAIKAPSSLTEDHDYLAAIGDSVREPNNKGCLDIYDIVAPCPLATYDPLGHPPGNGSLHQTTAQNFINDQPGFRDAIHAGKSTWRFYQSPSPFANGYDPSPYPMQTELFRRVVERMERVVISAGLDDMALTALGTQLALQSATWRGKQGFQSGDQRPLGNQRGTFHTERGVTLALVKNSGHEIPAYQPEVALKLHRFLLGQIGEDDLAK